MVCDSLRAVWSGFASVEGALGEYEGMAKAYDTHELKTVLATVTTNFVDQSRRCMVESQMKVAWSDHDCVKLVKVFETTCCLMQNHNMCHVLYLKH